MEWYHITYLISWYIGLSGLVLYYINESLFNPQQNALHAMGLFSIILISGWAIIPSVPFVWAWRKMQE